MDPHPSIPNLFCNQDGDVFRYNERRGIYKVKASPDKDGYLCFSITINGRRTSRKAHRIVAETYLGLLPSLEVNHKNGIKDDNHLQNLEVCTKSENHIHCRRQLKKLIGEGNGMSILKDEQVRDIRRLYQDGASVKHIAEMFNRPIRTIRHVVNRTRWRHLD